MTSQLGLSDVNLTSPAWSLDALSAAVSSSLGIHAGDVTASVTSYGVTITLQLAAPPANQSAAAESLAALVASEAGLSDSANISVTAAPATIAGRRRHALQSGTAALLVHIGGLAGNNPGAVSALQQQLQSPAMSAAASAALQVAVIGSSAAVDVVLLIVVSSSTPAVTTAATSLLAAGAQPAQLTAALQAAGLPATGVTVLTPPLEAQHDSSQSASLAPPGTPALATISPPPPPPPSPLFLTPPATAAVPSLSLPPPLLPPLLPASGSSGAGQQLQLPPADVAAISVSVAAAVSVAAGLVVWCRRRRGLMGKMQTRMPRFQFGMESDGSGASTAIPNRVSVATGHPRQSGGASPPVFTAFVRRLSESLAAMRASHVEGAPPFVSLLRRLSDGVAAMRTSSTEEGHPVVAPATPRLRRLSEGVAAILTPHTGSSGGGGLSACVPSRKSSPRDEEDISPTYPGTPGDRFAAALDAAALPDGEAVHSAGDGSALAPAAERSGRVSISIGMHTAGEELGARMSTASRRELLVSHSGALLGTRGGGAAGAASPPCAAASRHSSSRGRSALSPPPRVGRRLSSPGRAALSPPPQASGNRRLSAPEVMAGRKATSPPAQRLSSTLNQATGEEAHARQGTAHASRREQLVRQSSLVDLRSEAAGQAGTITSVVAPPRAAASRRRVTSPPRAAGSRLSSSVGRAMSRPRLDGASPATRRFSSPQTGRPSSWLPATCESDARAAGSRLFTASASARDLLPTSPDRQRARSIWRP